MRKLVSLFALTVIFTVSTWAQDVTGIWKTIDDETGKAKSEVEVYIKDGKVYGKILKLYDKPQTQICDKCPDEKKFNRKNKPVVGMDFVIGLKKDGKIWKSSEAIMDPNNGKIYDCEMELDPKDSNKLLVRGYIWVIYRTQTWHRIK
ncbi:MAG TPA: DUF2147 domain-containing protein [Bacteroidales bacterium]|nr:DUF2147 domain-containing protein [Bacteroidales bacterium]